MKIADYMKRKVFSISDQTTIQQAAEKFVEYHVGLLPVVDEQGKPVGVVGIGDLLSLELPNFIQLLPDLDFVHDFGAIETTRPTLEEIERPITKLMHPVTYVEETSGLLRAYALMLKRDLHDLPVVNEEGALVGIASRVDIGVAILSYWKTIGTSHP